jgi:hypothetical protein
MKFFLALSLLAVACTSDNTAASTECAALARRCALCPAGALKTECEATTKGTDANACKAKLNDNQDIRNNCVEPTVADGGMDPITDPCAGLQGRCLKCKSVDNKNICQAAVRDSEPGACRSLLQDATFSADCK